MSFVEVAATGSYQMTAGYRRLSRRYPALFKDGAQVRHPLLSKSQPQPIREINRPLAVLEQARCIVVYAEIGEATL